MDLHSSGLCLCWMCRCPLHQRSCRGTIVFPCGNLIRITQRDCAARWLVCIDVSCWLDSNTYVLGGTSLKALCQSGVWKQSQGIIKSGIRGIFAPLKHKSISCGPGGGTFVEATVDGNGTPLIRGYGCWGWSAWQTAVLGIQVSDCTNSYIVSLTTSGLGNACNVAWPLD